MPEDLQVNGALELGVIVLTIRYGKDLLLQDKARTQLSEEIVAAYRKSRDSAGNEAKTSSCIVMIESEVAGSPLVRALYELWQEVTIKGAGQVVCVDYPDDYIDTLTSLGLPSLAGFTLAHSKEQAISIITQ